MKKAQSQIITTVLIILLVLAAIVIVWQVVNSTIEKGAGEIESQSACLGLSIDISFDSTDNTVQLKPNKDIDGWRVYQDGVQVGTGKGSTVGTFENSVKSSVLTVRTDAKITSAGLIGDQWCEGMKEVVVDVVL